MGFAESNFPVTVHQVNLVEGWGPWYGTVFVAFLIVWYKYLGELAVNCFDSGMVGWGNLYLLYSVCVCWMSWAALHSSATLLLNSLTGGKLLLYTPWLVWGFGKGSLWPNSMSALKSKLSMQWSPGIMVGRQNGMFQAPIGASAETIDPMQASMVRHPLLCGVGVFWVAGGNPGVGQWV